VCVWGRRGGGGDSNLAEEAQEVLVGVQIRVPPLLPAVLQSLVDEGHHSGAPGFPGRPLIITFRRSYVTTAIVIRSPPYFPPPLQLRDDEDCNQGLGFPRSPPHRHLPPQLHDHNDRNEGLGLPGHHLTFPLRCSFTITTAIRVWGWPGLSLVITFRRSYTITTT